MFQQSGKRTKGIAFVLASVGILASLAAGLLLFIQKTLPVYWCIAIALGGILVCYALAIVIYAIGDTQVRVQRMEELVTPKPTYMEYVQDVKSARQQMKCEMCGKSTTELIPGKLVDQMGTRYRKVCRECFSKYSFDLDESAEKV